MKAEDTIMSNGALLEKFGTPDFTERQGREVQAEITWDKAFKAGMKEVVECIRKYGVGYALSPKQLKEWGIVG